MPKKRLRGWSQKNELCPEVGGGWRVDSVVHGVPRPESSALAEAWANPFSKKECGADLLRSDSSTNQRHGLRDCSLSCFSREGSCAGPCGWAQLGGQDGVNYARPL